MKFWVEENYYIVVENCDWLNNDWWLSDLMVMYNKKAQAFYL